MIVSRVRLIVIQECFAHDAASYIIIISKSVFKNKRTSRHALYEYPAEIDGSITSFSHALFG